MTAYTFISSRDPVGGDTLAHELARDVAAAGNEVALFLVENGAFLARAGVCNDLLAQLREAGVAIHADAFALDERGIADDKLAEGVTRSELSVVIDHLAAGRKVSWH